MNQPDLAKAAGLGLSTVVDFERERRQVSEKAVGSMRHALEAAGVIFIAENGEGPGVRLRKSKETTKEKHSTDPDDAPDLSSPEWQKKLAKKSRTKPNQAS